MILKYYNETKNFGDLLNPLIFNYFLPEFFDEDPTSLFLGIGTILGLERGNTETRKIVVFSSGFGFGDAFTYGEIPVIDERYDIICLRGPLTAKVLRQNISLAISDGALLLNHMNFPAQPKKYRYSYIPHHVSEGMFDSWDEIADAAGLHFISPQNDVIDVIRQIQQTEILITEAMHGAIIADIFRTPWIPVKAYSHINEFKWQDWTMSVNIELEFQYLSSLFNKRKIQEMMNEQMGQKWLKPFTGIAREIYQFMHDHFRKKEVVKELKHIKSQRPYLGKEESVRDKSDQLLEKIYRLKEKYTLM